MPISAETILKAFPRLIEYIEGDLATPITGPSSQNQPRPQTIAYISDEKFLTPLLASDVSTLVINSKMIDSAKKLNNGKKVLLSSSNLSLSMAQVNARLFSLPFLRSPFAGQSIHDSAVISQSASIGKNVVIGPGAVIADNVVIGDGSFIGAQTVIENNTQFGTDCFIHPCVYIGHSCFIKNRVEIKPQSTIGSDGFGYAHDEKNNHYRIPHYGAVIIEDDVHIGANVNIDRGTFDPAIIGEGTKIDNHCHFGHNCKVGKNCLITAGFIMAGSSTIGDNCVFGGRSSVNGHISICSNCRFAAVSVITGHVTQPGDYGGFPIISYRDSLRAQASLEHLPQLRKNFNRLLEKLGITLDEKK